MDALAGFDRDEGNREKCRKHGLSLDEIERALRHGVLRVIADERHSREESRSIAICRTEAGRYAFVGFTARYMHAKEVSRYEQQENP